MGFVDLFIIPTESPISKTVFPRPRPLQHQQILFETLTPSPKRRGEKARVDKWPSRQGGDLARAAWVNTLGIKDEDVCSNYISTLHSTSLEMMRELIAVTGVLLCASSQTSQAQTATRKHQTLPAGKDILYRQGLVSKSKT